jgi:predicted ATPase with chaperone activity
VVLVGLAETAVKENTHRVERAIVNSGYRRPIDRVVINLAPADLKKDAGGFDLPIALGLLLGSGQVSYDRPGSFAVVGELALTGETRPVKGVLAMALQAVADKRTGLLVQTANAQEAAVVEGLNGRMTARQVRKFCALKPEAMSLLKAAMEDLRLSAGGHDKVLRVARTIADLEGSKDIKPQHIAEAVGYRSLDRSAWA